MLACVAGVLTTVAIANEPGSSFQGDWRTTKSLVKLEQKGDAVTGSFGTGDRFSLKGSVKGNTLAFEYEEDQARGDGRFILDASDNTFTGSFQIRNGRRGYWNGWRPDPKAPIAKTGTYAGLWLTNLGLMELTQDGAKFEGRYAVRGTSKIEGKLTGRHLDLRFHQFLNGQGWFDFAADGKSVDGTANYQRFDRWLEIARFLA